MSEDIIGKYVTDPAEVERIVTEVKAKEDYKTIILELGKQREFNESELVETEIYMFDTLGNENEVISNRTVSLQTSDGTVTVDFVENTKEGEHLEWFDGTITKSFGDDEMLIGIRVLEGVPETVFIRPSVLEEDLSEADDEEAADEELPNDENYTPGILAEVVAEQGIFDFCLKNQNGKKYHHCGLKCGDGKNAIDGGGSTINSIDSCCKTHDSCYSSKTKNACCDKKLVNCAFKYRKQDFSTYKKINAVFGWTMPFC